MHGYLQGLGLVRSQLGADNSGRIPDLIRRQDSALLTDEVARLGQYRLSLGVLDPAGADAKAARLGQAVEASIEAYRSVCLDTAELFREVREADAKRPDHEPIEKTFQKSMQAARGDTLAALDSLLTATDEIDLTPGADINFPPIISAVRADQQKLERAISEERALANVLSSAMEP